MMRIERIGDCTLYNGDCLEVMAALPENSVDSIVCDPPYHLTSIVKRFGVGGEPLPITASQKRYGDKSFSDVPQGRNPEVQQFNRLSRGFMGKQWDGGDIAFQPETWAACLRVLKPGGYIMAFASTRGFGRMSVALEDAGFITHPFVAWIFGSGFPKATQTKVDGMEGWRYGGQALKPAMEPIYMGQKPFSEKTGTANIKRWGTGAINIDGCRVETDDRWAASGRQSAPSISYQGGADGTLNVSISSTHELGRWPANLIHDGSDEVVAAFPEADGAVSNGKTGTKGIAHEGFGGMAQAPSYADSGSAARFFYCAKANRKDREEGLSDRDKEPVGDGPAVAADNAYQRGKTERANTHPTVKPTTLMEYLVRLVTPPGGTVLDPFMGSGSTGKACIFEGFKFIGIEREAEYLDIAKGRIAWAASYKEPLPVAAQAQPADVQAANDNDLPLFRSAA